MTPGWLWRRGVRAVRRRPAPHVTLVVVFGVLALLAGGARLLTSIAGDLVPRLADGAHVVAYLKDDADDQTMRAVAARLARAPGISSVRFVSAAEALERLRNDVKDVAGATDLTNALEDGFLPRSLEIALAPEGDVTGRAEAIAARLRALPGVALVDAMTEGLTRLHAVLTLARGFGRTLLVLAAVAGLAALAGSWNADRPSRRAEVELLTWLGETPGRIRLPIAALGALAGGLGAAAGALVLWMLFQKVIRTPDLVDALGVFSAVRPRFLCMRELGLALAGFATAGFLFGLTSMPAPKRQGP